MQTGFIVVSKKENCVKIPKMGHSDVHATNDMSEKIINVFEQVPVRFADMHYLKIALCILTILLSATISRLCGSLKIVQSTYCAFYRSCTILPTSHVPLAS